MKEKVNWKTLGFGFLVVLVGIILIVLDIFRWKTSNNLWVNIGCSIIGSGLVIVLTALLIDRRYVNPLEEWGINKIYSTRAERNSEADPNIENARYCIDGIAFGLSTFRTMYGKKVEQCLRKGVQIRLITMDPEGGFISYREKEENSADGGIKQTIFEMVKWADELNRYNYKGKIVVKAYNSMTLDYYWRVDDDLYIGPYWYGYKSSDTITYKFVAGGRGFQHYNEYFEKLWDEKDLCRVLTSLTETPKRKRN